MRMLRGRTCHFILRMKFWLLQLVSNLLQIRFDLICKIVTRHDGSDLRRLQTIVWFLTLALFDQIELKVLHFDCRTFHDALLFRHAARYLQIYDIVKLRLLEILLLSLKEFIHKFIGIVRAPLQRVLHHFHRILIPRFLTFQFWKDILDLCWQLFNGRATGCVVGRKWRISLCALLVEVLGEFAWLLIEMLLVAVGWALVSSFENAGSVAVVLDCGSPVRQGAFSLVIIEPFQFNFVILNILWRFRAKSRSILPNILAFDVRCVSFSARSCVIVCMIICRVPVFTFSTTWCVDHSFFVTMFLFNFPFPLYVLIQSI